MTVVTFLRSEGGAITVDWTVLLAALVGAAVAFTNVIGGGLSIHADNVRGELQDPHFDTSWIDNLTLGGGQ